jgi:hypothetical protein
VFCRELLFSDIYDKLSSVDITKEVFLESLQSYIEEDRYANYNWTNNFLVSQSCMYHKKMCGGGGAPFLWQSGVHEEGGGYQQPTMRYTSAFFVINDPSFFSNFQTCFTNTYCYEGFCW